MSKYDKLNNINVETERKFIILKPDMDWISKLEGYTKSDIVQIYLISKQGISHRIRKRTKEGIVSYTETTKERISKMSAYENERTISEEKFFTLTKKRDTSTAPIIKQRHTFLYEGQLFEIDVYPNWVNSCIMELEIASEQTEINIPQFIKVIKEVTGIKEYSNASMSRNFPKEELI